MSQIAILLVLVANSSGSSLNLEQFSGEVQSIGFTSDGYYCEVKLYYEWIYTGEDNDLLMVLKDNVTRIIGTRLQLLFFESIAGILRSDLIKATEVEQIDSNSEMALQLKKKLYKKMQETDGFVSSFFESVTITTIEFFEIKIYSR